MFNGQEPLGPGLTQVKQLMPQAAQVPVIPQAPSAAALRSCLLRATLKHTLEGLRGMNDNPRHDLQRAAL